MRVIKASILGFVVFMVTFAVASLAFAEDKFAPPVKKVETSQEFVALGEAKGLQVVVFEADWCPYCTKYAPNVNKAAKKYSSTPFSAVDVEKAGVRIQGGIPQTAIVKDGIVILVIKGYVPYKELDKILKKVLGEII